jgi:predicted TIM-barrel fold metal-dependent hydrolase
VRLPSDWRDEDPGLPVEFGPCSNGEYDPEPFLPAVLTETIRRARAMCDVNAKRAGMSRREFLLSACGAAATLVALDACTREQHRADPTATTSAPGGSYTIPPSATVDPELGFDALGGREFVFDIQGHLLEYDLNPVLNGQEFWQAFPQQHCGEDDPRVCFGIDHFLDLMFLRSDTNMLVLSALPILPEGSPSSPEIMDVTRRMAEGLCRDDRVFLHAQALPNVGTPEAALDAMEATARRYPVVAWKTFTHFPAAFTGDGNGWWLDDRDPNERQVGEPFIRKAVDLGLPTICIHKGLSLGSPFGSPVDVGPAARRHRDANFVIYHSGFEAGLAEGPYTRSTRTLGVNRLISSMQGAGVGPNENVYAEIGSSWWYLMRYPTQAAHFLGKLLRYIGEDNVLWGTDCLFYGSPQPLIQALRVFEISEEFQERFGYPKLTPELKAKILGLNGANLYGVEPNTQTCAFDRHDLEQLRRVLPGRNGALGPRTATDVQAFRADDMRQWEASAGLLA